MEEWLVKAVMAMYEGAQTVVRTTEGDSKAFKVKVVQKFRGQGQPPSRLMPLPKINHVF